MEPVVDMQSWPQQVRTNILLDLGTLEINGIPLHASVQRLKQFGIAERSPMASQDFDYRMSGLVFTVSQTGSILGAKFLLQDIETLLGFHWSGCHLSIATPNGGTQRFSPGTTEEEITLWMGKVERACAPGHDLTLVYRQKNILVEFNFQDSSHTLYSVLIATV